VTKDQNPYEFWSNGRRLSTTRNVQILMNMIDFDEFTEKGDLLDLSI
jgi:hypothetical protein